MEIFAAQLGTVYMRGLVSGAMRGGAKDTGRPTGRPRWLALAPALLAAALYANTFHHDYVLDDDIALRRNTLVQQGLAGLPGIFSHGYLYGFNGLNYFYRPLSLATFAVEIQLFGNRPRVHHAVNIALFAACAALLYLLVLALLEPPGAPRPESAAAPPRIVALVTALLFAAHPIHTEVVANLKSRDELLCLFFILLMLRLLIAYADSRRPLLLGASALCYALAALSKETGLAALGLVPLTLWFFRPASLQQLATLTAPFAIVATVCLLVRHAVATDALPDDPAARVINNALAAAATPGARFATSVAVLGRYLGLLLVPRRLSYDYSYNQVPLVGMSDWRFLGALAAYIGMLLVAAWGLRRRHLISYAILWYALTIVLVSNLLFPLGTVMGERLLFTASVGFCMALAWLLVAVAARTPGRRVLVPLLGVILVLYSARSFTRNRDWKDEEHLYRSGILTAPHSARAWNHYATWRLGHGNALPAGAPERIEDLREAVSAYSRALQILPEYSEASFNLGVAYASLGDTGAARVCYERTLRSDSTNEGALTNLAGIRLREGGIAEARRMWLKVLEGNPHSAEACGNLGASYFLEGMERSKAGDARAATAALHSAAEWFQKAHDLRPESEQYVRYLAMTWSRLGDPAAAERWLNQLGRRSPSTDR